MKRPSPQRLDNGQIIYLNNKVPDNVAEVLMLSMSFTTSTLPIDPIKKLDPATVRKNIAQQESNPTKTIHSTMTLTSPKVDPTSTELPEDFTPSEYDVICGWARQNYHHAGNRRLRDMIAKTVPRYLAASTKTDKGKVIVEIVERLRRESPKGVGLVRQNQKNGRWYFIGTEKAKDKIGHALRKASQDYQRRRERYKNNKGIKKWTHETPLELKVDQSPNLIAEPNADVTSMGKTSQYPPSSAHHSHCGPPMYPGRPPCCARHHPAYFCPPPNYPPIPPPPPVMPCCRGVNCHHWGSHPPHHCHFQMPCGVDAAHHPHHHYHPHQPNPMMGCDFPEHPPHSHAENDPLLYSPSS